MNVVELRFQESPATSSKTLETRIKFMAKVFAKKTGITQSASLDTIANAARFSGWRELSLHLKNGASYLPGRVPEIWMVKLSKVAFAMISNSEPGFKLSEFISGAEEFSAYLAEAAGVEQNIILNNVMAALCGCLSWADARSSEADVKQNNEILFRFEIENGEGMFWGTEDGYKIFEEYYDLKSFSDEVNMKDYAWAKNIAEKHQTFFPAHHLMARYHFEHQEYSESKLFIKEGIRSAESYIPSGFRGKIPWAPVHSRPYHRLLALQMDVEYETKNIEESLASAKKQKRLNPNDDLGISYYIPLLHLEGGSYQAAMKASKFKREDDGALPSLVKAFSCFAVGDRQGYVYNLVGALLAQPECKKILLNSDSVLLNGDDGIRGINDDFYEYQQYLWGAYNSVNGLRTESVKICHSELYTKAEKELFDSWTGYRGKGDQAVGSFDEWELLRKKWHAQLIAFL
jgi:hypothetical protein